MHQVLAVVILVSCNIISSSGQSIAAQGCVEEREFAPVVVENSDAKVTFKCKEVTPLDLIRATAFQTRIPIGLAMGRDRSVLEETKRSFDLHGVDTRSALLDALRDTDYTIKEENGVLVLTAGDMTARQTDLLTHQYSDFKSESNSTMVELGAGLTMWMRAAIDPQGGFGASIGGATNDERFSLKAIPWATTEEIANRIASLGSKGMWIFRADAYPPSGTSTDQIVIEPYQHHSNKVDTGH
jgi:hypothetical protein